TYANVAKCELFRAWRLCSQSVELVGFRVPRKRPEYFQDDIFPDTVDYAMPSVDAAAWIAGAAATPRLVCMCPAGMTRLSEAPPEIIHRRVIGAVKAEQTDNTNAAIDAMLSRVDGSDDDMPGANANDSGSDWDD
ncbi:Coronin-7, partial [Coemansia aciculifera]